MADITANSEHIDEGRLVVNVTSPTIAVPVPDATVHILAPDTNKVLEELVTDSSGKTAEVVLGAPPLEHSMALDSVRPYAEYDIRVAANGFAPRVIYGVQILPHSTALQEVDLVAGDATSSPEIVIQEHTLWGIFPPKVGEDDVKPLPEAGGFVVLPEPVVPEFVVVHGGVPSNSAAPTYKVAFKDYIKNVASCEIYANWPEQTLIANVLAIISITLNRVYTDTRFVRRCRLDYDLPSYR